MILNEIKIISVKSTLSSWFNFECKNHSGVHFLVNGSWNYYVRCTDEIIWNVLRFLCAYRCGHRKGEIGFTCQQVIKIDNWVLGTRSRHSPVLIQFPCLPARTYFSTLACFITTWSVLCNVLQSLSRSSPLVSLVPLNLLQNEGWDGDSPVQIFRRKRKQFFTEFCEFLIKKHVNCGPLRFGSPS